MHPVVGYEHPEISDESEDNREDNRCPQRREVRHDVRAPYRAESGLKVAGYEEAESREG